MLKFIRGKGQQPSTERQKIQRELFAFRKTIQHGFPNKPTCLAWDPVLRLMAIGTATGAIKVVGKPGVEFYGHHTSLDHHITRLLFVPNEGRLISLCDDNSLHLWEINDSSMEEVKANKLEGKLNKITVMRLESSGRHLLLGLEGGNVNLLNVATFEFSSAIIFQDKIVQSVEEDYKINPGAVEAIEEQPGNADNVLIGYNRGLMVLWNRKTSTAEQTFISSQQLESVSWDETGKQFVSSHNDGSYAYWDAASQHSKPLEEPSTPYGPFPCKAITKILWTHDATQPTQDLLLFSGGMTRASYGDKNTITALRGKHISEGKHVIFDFTSKIIDFFTISAPQGEKGVIALVVLAEEELVAIDLASDEWKMIGLPYLVSLHASAITCATYVSDVPRHTWDNIAAIGKTQNKGLYSDAEWPINGGVCSHDDGGEGDGHHGEGRDILLTGHEDGSVRFWRAGGVALSPLYTFASKQAMHAQDDDLPDHPADGDAVAALDNGADNVDDDDDDWPFRKVGSFDPYSDDPRLAVKKVLLCANSATLAVAGTAGHVIIAKLNLEPTTTSLKAVTVNLVNDRDAFVWKGHSRLLVKGGGEGDGGGGGGGLLHTEAGFQPFSVVQLHPPAAVTALALLAEPLGLVAVGTAHGLAVYDFVRHTPVAAKCTLNPNDLSGAGDVPISRRKSFKKSLRESFRRLRKGRSTRRPEKRNLTQSPSTPENKKIVESPTSPIEAKPVERAIESRAVDDSLGSMVRCLAFANTYIVTVQNTMPTLWAGTNNGTVYVFTIATARDADKKKDAPIGCQLGKEIQLKHRAPVIGINVIDSLCYPVDPLAKHGLNPPHRVIISSEEQIKIFTLPQLKPFNKLKLTAAEGARVRRTALAEFKASVEGQPGHGQGQHDQVCLLCLTNLGDTIVLSLPDLRRQINAAVIRKEDINGISSVAFTWYGEGVYLHSSSELQRVTVSATRVTLPHCRLQLPASARDQPPSAATPDSDDDDDSSSSSSSDSSSSSSSSSDTDHSQQQNRQQNKDVVSKPSTEQQQEQQKQGGGQLMTSSANAVVKVVGGAVPTVVENGVNGVGGEDGGDEVGEGEGGEEREQDVTALSVSVGDITIDSVKDHLVNSSTLSEESSTRVICTTTNSNSNSNSNSEVTTSNNKVDLSSSVTEQSQQSAVTTIKRTTTTITTSNQATNTTLPPQDNLDESEAPEMDSAHLLDEIRKAPLAKMEDLELEMAA